MRATIASFIRRHAVLVVVVASTTSLLALAATPRRGWVMSFRAVSPDRTGYVASNQIEFGSPLERGSRAPNAGVRAGAGTMELHRLHPRLNGIDMVGTVNAQFGPSGVRIMVDAIVNSRNAVSGPLRLALWATDDPPVFGEQIFFFDLGGGGVGTVPASSQINNVDTGLQPFTEPPSGCYWLTVALIEDVQGTEFYTDLATGDGQFAFGSGSCAGPTPTVEGTAEPTLEPTLEPTTEPTIGPTMTPLPCVPNIHTLCLNQDRFGVITVWRRPNGTTGMGNAVQLTDDTGYFWFFDGDNVEIVVKVLNACSDDDGRRDGARAASGRYWVFAGGLTNVEVRLTVTDSEDGTVKEYLNPLGVPFQPLQDTNAFSRCP